MSAITLRASAQRSPSRLVSLLSRATKSANGPSGDTVRRAPAITPAIAPISSLLRCHASASPESPAPSTAKNPDAAGAAAAGDCGTGAGAVGGRGTGSGTGAGGPAAVVANGTANAWLIRACGDSGSLSCLGLTSRRSPFAATPFWYAGGELTVDSFRRGDSVRARRRAGGYPQLGVQRVQPAGQI